MNITGGTPNQNVFGGGKGYAETFWCEKGMVYSTDVRVSNVTLNGSVYGGGELGRVETNTKVTVGPESGTDATEIKGNVFGAGQGVETHGYSALFKMVPRWIKTSMAAVRLPQSVNITLTRMVCLILWQITVLEYVRYPFREVRKS